MVREGDLIFLKIKFFQGAPVSAAASVGPGRCPPGTRTPFPPRAYLAQARCFILCLLEAGLASPCGGRYVPVARCLAAGLRFRSGRSWTVPTGHQDPSRQARRCHAGGVTEGVSSKRFPPPYPLPRTHSLRRGRCAGAGGGDYSIYLISKGGDGRQWRPSIADRGGSRDRPL